MAIDYSKTAKELVKELGGDDNIYNVTHCATRLRFILKDESIVNKERVSKITGVITTVTAGGQFQVVIGNHVKDAYQHVLENITIREDIASPNNGAKVGWFNKIIDVISSIFAPFLYTLAACGILQGILGVFVALDWIDTSTGTYQILNFISWTAFTFLPVLISITAAKKFHVNTYTAVVIACALVSPDYIKMVEAGQEVSFLGLPVQLLSYTSSVIPIILTIWVASYVQKFFEKYLPIVIRNLFTPMFTIMIMVPLTLLAFGPIGNTIGNAIGDIYNGFYSFSPIVAGMVVGGLWQILVIFGVHWGITPVTTGNYHSLGYDTFTGLQASAVFSQAGAAFGVFLKTKDKDMKGVSLSAGLTGLFGITEPAIYGVNLRLKKPMICGCIAGAIGGAIAVFFNSVSWVYNIPGIATLPAYFKAGHIIQFLGFLLSIIVSFVLAAVFTYIIGFEEKQQESDDVKSNEEGKSFPSPVMITSPVQGEVIALSEVKDEVFSSKAMGDGVAIIPTTNEVYAPFDGVAEVVFPTGHAIGLKSKEGIETLIHIGIDTVKLNGKGFSLKVKQGDMVKQGDLLVTFDRHLIQNEGYDPSVIFIITNMNDYELLDKNQNTSVDMFTIVFHVHAKEV